MIAIIVTIVWTIGSVFFLALTYFFDGAWKKEMKMPLKYILKVIGWPFYVLYRIFSKWLFKYFRNGYYRK